MKLFISAVVSAIALVSYSNGAFASVSFAVVSDGGSLVRGKNAVSAARVGEGEYTVKFNQNIRQCGFVVSLGAPGTGLLPTGQASAGSDPSSNTKIDVETTSSDGTDSNRSFHLVVVCP